MKNNGFDFKYLETFSGWIKFEISYGADKFEYFFSYAGGDSPIVLLEWAEKILDGENSEICFDEEGSLWFLEYDGKNVIVSDDKDEEKKSVRLKFEYDRQVFCKKLYTSFLDFISSGIYVPREWESYNFLSIFTGKKEKYDNSEEYTTDLKEIAKLSSEEIKDKLIYSDSPTSIYDWLDLEDCLKGYDSATLEKKTDILDYIADASDSFNCKSLLRYRSKKLESLLEKKYNIISFVKEKNVDLGFEQFNGYCFVIDGKRLLFDSYTLLDAYTIQKWTENRVIVNMCTCGCWECDCVIAEVFFSDYIIWKVKKYRSDELLGEYTFTRENYFKVFSGIQTDAVFERHNIFFQNDKENLLMQKIKLYFAKNGFNNDYGIDKPLFSFITGQNNLSEFVNESILLSKHTNSTIVKFNYEDKNYRKFVLFEKYYGNLGLGIIIEELGNSFKIIKVFIKSNATISISQGTYYPDDEEARGHFSMAVGASDTDFYDNELIFERDFFEEWIRKDFSYNVFALAVPDTIKGYNDFDCIGDEIEPLRKIFVKAKKIIKEKNFGKDFYRVKADVNSLPITENEIEYVESVIFIPFDLVKNEQQLLDGVNLNLILFGSKDWNKNDIFEEEVF